MYIMARHITEETKYYPLILLSFPLFAPHTLVEAEKFNIRYPSPDMITNIFLLRRNRSRLLSS